MRDSAWALFLCFMLLSIVTACIGNDQSGTSDQTEALPDSAMLATKSMSATAHIQFFQSQETDCSTCHDIPPPQNNILCAGTPYHSGGIDPTRASEYVASWVDRTTELSPNMPSYSFPVAITFRKNHVLGWLKKYGLDFGSSGFDGVRVYLGLDPDSKVSDLNKGLGLFIVPTISKQVGSEQFVNDITQDGRYLFTGYFQVYQYRVETSDISIPFLQEFFIPDKEIVPGNVFDGGTLAQPKKTIRWIREMIKETQNPQSFYYKKYYSYSFCKDALRHLLDFKETVSLRIYLSYFQAPGDAEPNIHLILSGVDQNGNLVEHSNSSLDHLEFSSPCPPRCGLPGFMITQ